MNCRMRITCRVTVFENAKQKSALEKSPMTDGKISCTTDFAKIVKIISFLSLSLKFRKSYFQGPPFSASFSIILPQCSMQFWVIAIWRYFEWFFSVPILNERILHLPHTHTNAHLHLRNKMGPRHETCINYIL